MTQQDLLDLGFEKVEYTQEELENNGIDESPYFLYSFALDQSSDAEGIELVTNENTAFDLPDVNGDGWYVEFSDYTNIRFYKKEDVKQLIEIFIRNKRKG